MTNPPDALIVGGGPAGSALAIALARAGRSVVLLEREAGPHHKVCGEFLSHEAVLLLSTLGLDLNALGAQRIDHVRLESGSRSIEAMLPFGALSLSRRSLDDALLRRASSCGADVRVGAKAQSLERRDGGWHARLPNGEDVAGRQVFIATGKHDLRGWNRPPEAQTDFIGFKLHWRLSPEETRALGSHVELSLFRGGYAGLELVENGVANLCLVVRKSRFARLGQSWEALLGAIRSEAPLLDRRLSGGQASWGRPLAVSGIPYGYVRRTPGAAWFLGDQAAVIPSFSGDGMSIALHSARLAAAEYLAGAEPGLFQRHLARDIGQPVKIASLISGLAVDPLGRMIITPLLTLLPGAVARIAAGTRVPERALRRLGLNVGP
ncbi:MAG TPA: NAD(P)/FAD-dependent oxidoreductase [Alphaproteobacteria bacterium]|nr:NAD(P)/FAD-dependent oxidoreductase [Alphaproteobacteria bacterium]